MVRLLRLMKTKPLIFIETKTEVALSIPPYYTLCYMFYLQLNIFINDLTAIFSNPPNARAPQLHGTDLCKVK